MSTNQDYRLVELKTAHERLANEVAELRNWWKWREESGQPSFGEMSRRVMKLRDCLVDHFTFEEQKGYFALAAELRPDLTTQVDQLLEDHKQIRQMLGDLASQLATGSKAYSNWEEPYQKLDGILDQLYRHEQAEHGIFESAFGQHRLP